MRFGMPPPPHAGSAGGPTICRVDLTEGLALREPISCFGDCERQQAPSWPQWWSLLYPRKAHDVESFRIMLSWKRVREACHSHVDNEPH
jgi:hypothetical protein